MSGGAPAVSASEKKQTFVYLQAILWFLSSSRTMITLAKNSVHYVSNEGTPVTSRLDPDFLLNSSMHPVFFHSFLLPSFVPQGEKYSPIHLLRRKGATHEQ